MYAKHTTGFCESVCCINIQNCCVLHKSRVEYPHRKKSVVVFRRKSGERVNVPKWCRFVHTTKSDLLIVTNISIYIFWMRIYRYLLWLCHSMSVSHTHDVWSIVYFFFFFLFLFGAQSTRARRHAFKIGSVCLLWQAMRVRNTWIDSVAERSNGLSFSIKLQVALEQSVCSVYLAVCFFFLLLLYHFHVYIGCGGCH